MITQNDLILLKSQDMNDYDDSGGLPSANIITDKSNEIFDDISDLQATYGAVSLRKIFGGVQTDNDDKLLASRFIITKPPTNPNVSVFMFSDEWAGKRKSAEQRLTAYLSVGVLFSGHILENQLKGQRSIQLSLGLKDELPSVGDKLVLVQNEGQNDEYSQFVTILKVTTKTRQFPAGRDKMVERVVATLELGETLEYEFNGLSVVEFLDGVSTKRRAVARETVVAAANKIASASHIKEPITAMTSNNITLNSIFAQVVPSSQRQVPLVGLNPAMVTQSLVGTTGLVNQSYQAIISPSVQLFLGSGVLPSSLSISVGGQALDDNNGELAANNEVYGRVDYHTGIVSWVKELGSRTVSYRYTPAALISQVGNTDAIIVPKVGASSVYVTTLPTPPTPLSLKISYQVNSRVYTMYDDGKGNLIGQGTGVVDYATGDVTITTNAIPDSSSVIILSYGDSVNVFEFVGDVANWQAVLKTVQAPSNGTTITWGTSTATYQNGKVTGNATGVYDMALGAFLLKFDKLPPKGTSFNITNLTGGTKKATDGNGATVIAIAGGIKITLDTKPIVPNQLEIEINGVVIGDDGAGNLILLSQTPKQLEKTTSITTGTKTASEQVNTVRQVATAVGTRLGVVDYSTGVLSLTQNLVYEESKSSRTYEYNPDTTPTTNTVAKPSGFTSSVIPVTKPAPAPAQPAKNTWMRMSSNGFK